MLIDSAMGDEEGQETMFEEAAKTAWVRVFIVEASDRGHTAEDVFAVLDEPETAVEATMCRILSTRKPE